MNYSLNFKPRFMFGIVDSGDPNNQLYFNFYDYSKNKDIKCYENDGETEIEKEIVSRVLNKFCSEKAEDFVYEVKYTKLAGDLGDLWWAQAIIKEGHIVFFGYSQFSAKHAVEDLETAKKLIMDYYYDSEEAVRIQEAYKLEIEQKVKEQMEAAMAESESPREEDIEEDEDTEEVVEEEATEEKEESEE